MYKKIIYFSMYMSMSAMPLLSHLVFDIITGMQSEYKNYYSEVYFINLFAFAYIFTFLNYKYGLSNNIKGTILLFVLIINFLIATLINMTSYYQKYSLKIFTYLVVLTIFNVVFTMIMEIILIIQDKDYNSHDSENRYENRYERYLLERIDEKLNSIKSPKSEKNEEDNKEIISSEELMNGSDILAEMLKNHIEIKEYFRISKNQSKFSFYFSIVSSVVGIIVVIIAASGIVVLKNLGISIIAAVSGAITEIISGIVLWIHNKSALQLNYYYDSLHENEKFLSAVNIADKLSDDKKEDMYMEIIRKQIDIQSQGKENITSDTDKK